jgi:hypothetical protein
VLAVFDPFAHGSQSRSRSASQAFMSVT